MDDEFAETERQLRPQFARLSKFSERWSRLQQETGRLPPQRSTNKRRRTAPVPLTNSRWPVSCLTWPTMSGKAFAGYEATQRPARVRIVHRRSGPTVPGKHFSTDYVRQTGCDERCDNDCTVDAVLRCGC
jgi:hypothetical protein